MIYWFVSILFCVLAILIVDYYTKIFSRYLDSVKESKILYLCLCFFILPLFILLFSYMGEQRYTEIEYRGSYIKHVGFNEYWETWVEETCSRQVECGEDCTTDSNGNRSCETKYCTEYYDCSYCDENSEEFYVVDEMDRKYYISKEKYFKLIDNWKSENIFYDLGRKIKYNKKQKCGIDGDNYTKAWDRNIYTSENLVYEVSYENKGKSKASGYYKFSNVSKEDATKLNLYEYPKIYKDDNLNKQRSVLGLNHTKYSKPTIDSINALYDYINAKGEHLKCKVLILLFPNSDISKAVKQRDYWKGGARNELIICIGIDTANSNKLDWVYSFGISDSHTAYYDSREEIMQRYDTLDLIRKSALIEMIIKQEFVPKDISYFDYIKNTKSNGYYITSFIFFILIVFGIPFLPMYIDYYRKKSK